MLIMSGVQQSYGAMNVNSHMQFREMMCEQKTDQT